jgi:hypothetical protein
MYRVIITVFLMICFELNCQNSAERQAGADDSSLVKSTYAQSDTNSREITEEQIFQSRQNAITRAVAKVSPAVVGITVIQHVVRRSPFMDDP